MYSITSCFKTYLFFFYLFPLHPTNCTLPSHPLSQCLSNPIPFSSEQAGAPGFPPTLALQVFLRLDTFSPTEARQRSPASRIYLMYRQQFWYIPHFSRSGSTWRLICISAKYDWGGLGPALILSASNVGRGLWREQRLREWPTNNLPNCEIYGQAPIP